MLTDLQATAIGSALSGLIARIPCHPLDTAKARLQIQGALPANARATAASVVGILKDTYKYVSSTAR